MGLFDKIKQGLAKTRDAFLEKTNDIIKIFVKVDEELLEELLEALIMSDVGFETSTKIIDKLRDRAKGERIKTQDDLSQALQEIISEIMEGDTLPMKSEPPLIIMVIGVNGAGKTTSIGKLAHYYKEQGKSVMVAAADTFRAAAIDQLDVWAKRADVPIVKMAEGSDPSAVVYNAIKEMKETNTDILICDTAGRLHNKKNLMDELAKMNRIILREYPEANYESLLVLDATTGQNALSQAKSFGEVADITGVVLTKLDGTAKGGIVITIKSEQQIPVRFVGVGEKIDDLIPFNPKDYANALFDRKEN